MRESEYYKIRVSVPVEAGDKVREAINRAGGSRQGNYDLASFTVVGKGRFRPLTGAKPAIGEINKVEVVNEEMIECLCHRDKLAEVIAAVRGAHPYEEPAIDVMKRYEA